MKKNISLLGMLLIGMIVFGQIDIPQVQKSFYGAVEATWCGNCGQYGIPTTNNITNQVGNKVVTYTLHKSSSSQLYSPTAVSIANAIGTSGQPYFTLNGMALGGYSATIENTIINSINSNYSATTADVNAGFEWRIENDTIYVETLTEFFSSVNGDYNIAVYVSEDNVNAYQANYDPNIPNGNINHQHILRTSVSQNAFGVQVASGSIASGSTFSNTQKIALESFWNENNIHLAAFIWKNNGGNYDFVNANDDGEKIILTSDDKVSRGNINLQISPNPVIDKLSIKSNNLNVNSLVRLVDFSGRIVYQNKIEEGANAGLDISVANLASGKYIVSIISNETISSEQVIVK
ncbi:MAG: Omp28-related outer membrane protein [Vicingaceae bacterium]|nr:Omp28-related outer membrane protein [Vicingaceae bacterium]